MKIWIPMCGDAVKLLSDWCAELLIDRQNFKTIDSITGSNLQKGVWHVDASSAANRANISLRAGDELVFDRIYVRQNNDEFASVTFIIKRAADEALVGQRFWVKLSDANKIDAELLSRDNPVGGLAAKTYITALKAEKDAEFRAQRAGAMKKRNELESVKEVCRAMCRAPADPIAMKMAAEVYEKLKKYENRTLYSAESVLYAASCKLPKNHFNSEHWRVKSLTKTQHGKIRRVYMCWTVSEHSSSKFIELFSDTALDVSTDEDGCVTSVSSIEESKSA